MCPVQVTSPCEGPEYPVWIQLNPCWLSGTNTTRISSSPITKTGIDRPLSTATEENRSNRMPVRMRRMGNPRIAMSAASRRGYVGGHVRQVRSAAVGEHLALAPAPAAAPPGREDPLGARVQRVPDPVAEQVEGERGDE